jgi:hypothetical protein
MSPNLERCGDLDEFVGPIGDRGEVIQVADGVQACGQRDLEIRAVQAQITDDSGCRRACPVSAPSQ